MLRSMLINEAIKTLKKKRTYISFILLFFLNFEVLAEKITVFEFTEDELINLKEKKLSKIYIKIASFDKKAAEKRAKKIAKKQANESSASVNN